MKATLEIIDSFSDKRSEDIHQLESWKNRYRVRRAEKKFQILLAQRTISQDIEKLRVLIEHLQKQSKRKHIPLRNEGDDIYDMHKDELESNHMGKIVAIDLDSKEIVGYGSTIEQAYFDAKLNEPQKDQFYFRKVGSSYVEIL